MTFEHTFRIYKIFNTHFRNEADAKALASEIEGLVSSKIGYEKAELATKKDIAELKLLTKNDIAELKLATRNDIAEFKLSTKNDINQLRSEVTGEIKQLEIKMGEGFKDLLKWMIALIVGFASLILTFSKILN